MRTPLAFGREALATRAAHLRVLISSLFLVAVSASAAFAVPLTGTINIPGAAPFTTLASSITELNAQGVGAGGVTLNLLAGNPQTAPAAGYVVGGAGSLVLTSSSAANPVTIQGNGNTITAFTPQATGSAAASFDAVFKVVGADFITIQNFTMNENAGNVVITPGTTNTMTEFGVVLVPVTATDGAQNNTIQNNTITLSTTYTNSVGIFSTSSSTSANASLDATSTAGTNSNNKFYGNTISAAQGIGFICPPVTATVFETGNDIGGSAAGTANNITFGNATTPSGAWNRSQSTVQAGIFFRNGAGNSTRFNTVTSNSAVYVGSGGLNGIFYSSGTTPTGVTYTTTISNNTVSLTTTGLALVTGIDFGHGLTTGTIVGSNNGVTVTQTPAASTSAAIIGIKANYTSATNTANGNTVIMNQSASTGTNSGPSTGITLAGTASTTITANSNGITLNETGSGTGVLSGTQTPLSIAGSSTVNTASLNTIVVNQNTSVASGISGNIVGVMATTAAITSLNIGPTNQITVKQAATGAGTYLNSVSYISMSAAHNNPSVTNNTFNTTGSTIRSTGALDVILMGGTSTLTGTLTITGNTVNIDRVGGSGAVGFYTQTSTTPNDPTDNISSNNVTFTGLAGNSTATVINRIGGSTTATRTISNNTISVAGTNTGTEIGIVSGFAGTATMSGNSVTLNSAAATVTGITANSNTTAASISTSTLSLTSSSTAPTAMTGISVAGSGAHAITNNTSFAMNFSGITTTSAIVSGIAVSGNSGANVSGNTITGISVGAAGSTASPIVDGILISGGTSINVFKNKIYGLSTLATGFATTVNGIRLSGGTTNNVSNNLIGNLSASLASNSDALRGISITSTTTSSSNNVFYNTVYLNASSSNTPFGTTGIFHTTSPSATTATLNMRNNVIVNLSTPTGAGLTVAYRRSSNDLTNFASSSNNNLLYAGTPGASRLIFYDGTAPGSYQTIGAYRSGVGPTRETAAVTENPPFLSTTGANANFLHIDPSVATQIESGGSNTPSTGVTDDYDGDLRAATPDIGADEGTFTLADFVGPTISYTALGNSSATLSRSFTPVTVTDASGVNGTSGTRPRVYYKRSGEANNFVGNTSADNGWKFVEAGGASSPFSFTIDYTKLPGGAAAPGDVIQYFVVAQDLASPANVAINQGTFAAQPSSVALTAAAFPIGPTIRTYTILAAPLNGDYTVGLALFNQATGSNVTFEKKVEKVMREVYEPADQLPQLTNGKSSTQYVMADQVAWKTVMREVEVVSWVPMENGQKFVRPLSADRMESPSLPPVVNAGVYATITAAVADLNTRGVSGPVRFLLTDASYPTETFPITVNVTTDFPTAANPVTIKPSPTVTTSVTGASASNALFKIFNTNYITIDGSNTVGGTTRNMTIENTSATSPLVVWFGSSGTTPITNGTLKNCVVRNGANTSSAVVISDGTTAGNAGYFSTMEVRNNKIEKALVGAFANGGTTPQNGSSVTYADNDLSASGATAIRNIGLYMQGVNGATVSNNTVSNLSGSDDENDVGIWLASGTINATVSQNQVSNMGYSGTSSFAPIGIDVTSAVSANVNVTRNTVTNISTNGSTAVRGIGSPVSGTADVIIQRNNVSGITNTNSITYGAYGIDAEAGNNFTIKNNFVSDLRFNMTGGAAFSTTFGVFGIRVAAGTGHIVDDNSVNMFGSMTGTAATSLLSAALAIVTTNSGVDLRNNLLSNTLTGGTTSIAHVSLYLPSGGTSSMALTDNNNAYFSGSDAARQGIAQAGTTAGTGFYLASNFNAGSTSPASNLRNYSSTLSAAGTNDNKSLASSTTSAPYTSTTNLHVNTATFSPISNAGASVGSIAEDFDGDARSATPDIGADEFSYPAPTVALTSDVNPSLCGGTVNLTATLTPSSGPTGTVQFFDGATPLGTSPVSGGVATLAVVFNTTGSHSLTAVYSGDTNYPGNTSPAYSQTVNSVTTTTSLTSDVNPSLVGGKVNLSATVSPAAATGTVEFFDGATSLGTAPVVSGVATLSVTFSTAGAHSLTATYGGGGCYSGSTSNTYTQNVNLNATTTSLASDNNPSNCGDKVNLTATVAPAAATGTVEFFDGATSLGTSPVSGGVATLSVTSFAVGTHSLTATYSGDNTYATSTSSSVSQVVNSIATTTSLTTDVNPSFVGGKVNLTATVSSGGGTVEFFDGATSLGTSPVVSGVATLSVNFSTAGKHSLTATYGGDACHTGSTSAPYSQVVNLNPTTTSLASDNNPSNCGDKVTLTATVAPAAATGTVEFFDGATSLGTSPVSGGVATLSVTNFAVGTHSLTATYSGDGVYATSSSSAVSQVVNSIATTTSLTSDVNPSFVGGKVNLTATVSSGTGSVQFFDGANPLGSAPVVSGVAMLSVFFNSAGKHNLTASYGGDACHTGSTSAPYSQTVNLNASTTTLTSDVNPSNCGDKVTLTATVSPAAATGTVEFFDGATSLGTSPISGGVATLSVTNFAVGTHSLTATYGGDNTYDASTSSAYSQVVNSIATTTSLTSDVNPSFVGAKVNLTATVSSGGGTVQFFDGANPLGSAPVSGGIATLSATFSSAGKHSLTASYGGDACHTGSTSAPYSQVVNLNPTTTSLTSDVNPSNCGGKVNLTATVSPAAATGAVQFFDGATLLGTSPVVGGVATLSVSTLAVGTHSLTATYGGNSTYATSTSAPYSQVVNAIATTTSLTSDVNPSLVGGKVNLTATVAPSGATGAVEFFDGVSSLGSAPVSGGIATLSVTFSSAGKHNLTATYGGDACHSGSASAPYSQTVNLNPTTTTLASDLNPSNCGDKVNLTATVSPAAATGSVAFFDGATPLGSAPVSGGVATLSVSTLAVGTHSLTAVYSGDGTYAGSSSAALSQVVNAIATTTSLTSDVNPSIIGGKVNLTATVSSGSGTVQFFDGANLLGSAPVSGGMATLSVHFATAGKHNLTATYSGDACHSGSTSAPYSQTVNLNPSVTVLTSDVNPSDCGAKVNLKATVPVPNPTGSVEFFEGTTSLGTVPLASGQAILSVTGLSVGKHTFTAVYSGNSNYAGSTSNPYSQVVNLIVTGTSLTSDVNPLPLDNKGTLTATVSPTSATGTVEFFDGATSLGTSPVIGGIATLSVMFTSEGKHVLAAVYSGDGCHAPSTSAPYSQTVSPPTSVLLSLFEANTVNEGVELRWQFSDATDLATAWVERSLSATGPWTRVEMPVTVTDGITVGVDREVDANRLYNYRLVASLQSGGTQIFSPVEGRSGALVFEFALAKISPNPMRHDVATIEYTVAKESKVSVSIVDLQGRVVASVVSGVKAAGRYTAQWNRRSGGRAVPAGVYFVRYQTPNKVTTKRLVLQ